MDQEFDLTQSSAQLQAIFNLMQPLAETGDMGVLGYGYGVCSTAGDNAAKIASLTNYVLKPGGIVSVLFQNAFTVSSPTLNINSQGAKPIKLYGSAIAPGKVRANTILTMSYDGTNFNVIAIESQSALSTQGAVDLGLPSGLLWCEHNIGASRPEDIGLYFSWGNPTGHAEGSGYDFSQGVYDLTPGAALTADIVVGDTYDMAHHNMGGLWRLPRPAEFSELNSNCDHEWIDQDGMNGMRFTSRINGNSIFFPAAGYYNGAALCRRGSYGFYWSSGFGSATNAYSLSFDSSSVNPQYSSGRRLGFTVRAVQ